MEALEAAIAAGAPYKHLASLAEASLPGQRSQKAEVKPSGHVAAAAAALCKVALKALDSALQQQVQKSSDDEAHWAAVAASHAVDALEACRASIKGSPDEPEAQRYSLLRRLVGLRRYDAALTQACKLLRRLPDPQRGQGAAKGSGGGGSKLRLSAPGQEESQRTVLMAVGCTLNLVLCAVELGGDHIASAVHLLDDIEPWARFAPNPVTSRSRSVCGGVETHFFPPASRYDDQTKATIVLRRACALALRVPWLLPRRLQIARRHGWSQDSRAAPQGLSKGEGHAGTGSARLCFSKRPGHGPR